MDVKTLIDQWPTRADLAADIRAQAEPGLSVQVDAVHKWAQNGSIPAKYHYWVLKSARQRGVNVDAETLAKMHSPA